jgi:hypothetical protein
MPAVMAERYADLYAQLISLESSRERRKKPFPAR